MYLVLFICVILLSPVRLIPVKDESRIYGGREAKEGEFPWMVFIRLADELNCSGFLISTSYLVTAAHCMTGRSVKSMVGVVGSTDREHDTLEFQHYIIHPDYNETTQESDVAVLKFQTPLQLTNLIKPICLGKRNSFFQPGNSVLQMGWGRDRINSAIVSKKLKVLESGSIISETYCATFFTDMDFSLEGRICLMNSEVEGVCEGDSGGPLVYKDENNYIAIGSDSVGFYIFCNVTNLYPEIFTDIGYYADWIVTVVDEPVCVIE
uniref:Serine proteinase n=1 Tax=Hadrurus spadix TaxID=141984 RepID=A0A1W7R9J1_9SCOR